MAKVIIKCDIYANTDNTDQFGIDHIGYVVAVSKGGVDGWKLPSNPVQSVYYFVPLKTDVEIEVEADLSTFDIYKRLKSASSKTIGLDMPRLRIFKAALRDLFFSSTRKGKVFKGCAPIMEQAIEDGLALDTAKNRKIILISLLGFANEVNIITDSNSVVISREYLVK